MDEEFIAVQVAGKIGELVCNCISSGGHERQRVSGPLDPDVVGQSLLAADAYTDPAWFAAEQRAISGSGWVWAGYEHWLAELWATLDLGRLALVATRCFDIAANWKLVVENFLDFCHLPFIHPQVGSAAAALDVDDVLLDDRIIGGTYPRGATGKASKAGRPMPTFGDAPLEVQPRQDRFCLFPNALLFMEADWFQVIGFEPISPDRTIEHMALFVDRDAMGDEFASARSSLADVIFGVNEQDVLVLARLQAGRQSAASGRGNLVAHWDQIGARFQLLVRDAMLRQ